MFVNARRLITDSHKEYSQNNWNQLFVKLWIVFKFSNTPTWLFQGKLRLLSIFPNFVYSGFRWSYVILTIWWDNFVWGNACLHIQVCAVLKGSSYGMGYKLGLYLQQYVDYFAVACTVEGVWMRDFGIRIPILVFNPCVESFDKIIHYELEPTIYSMRMLKLLIEKTNCQDKVVIDILLNKPGSQILWRQVFANSLYWRVTMTRV